MVYKWISLVSGVPTVSNFGTTQGAGAPLCVDTTTGIIYGLINEVVTALSQTANSPFRILGQTSSQARLFATVNGADYGFSEVTLGLGNPAAPFPFALLYSFGAEGVYNALGVVTSRDFYIFDDVANVYRLYTDQTGQVNIGGADAQTNPGLIVTTNGALIVPEVASASVVVPAAGHQALFIDTADHKLKRKDSANVVTTIA